VNSFDVVLIVFCIGDVVCMYKGLCKYSVEELRSMGWLRYPGSGYYLIWKAERRERPGEGRQNKI